MTRFLPRRDLFIKQERSVIPSNVTDITDQLHLMKTKCISKGTPNVCDAAALTNSRQVFAVTQTSRPIGRYATYIGTMQPHQNK